MLKSDRLAPDFVWNHSLFWLFLKSVKTKVLFVSAWLLTKSCFCTEPAQGGSYENGASFYQPPFLSGKFTLKILTLQTYLVGGRSENAGKFLSSPNGLFGFSPTFYPQKASILTEVMGEDKKTLTVFSTLAKNSVKFFSQKGFTRALSLLFANILDLCSNRRDTPCVNEKDIMRDTRGLSFFCTENKKWFASW